MAKKLKKKKEHARAARVDLGTPQMRDKRPDMEFIVGGNTVRGCDMKKEDWAMVRGSRNPNALYIDKLKNKGTITQEQFWAAERIVYLWHRMEKPELKAMNLSKEPGSRFDIVELIHDRTDANKLYNEAMGCLEKKAQDLVWNVCIRESTITIAAELLDMSARYAAPRLKDALDELRSFFKGRKT